MSQLDRERARVFFFFILSGERTDSWLIHLWWSGNIANELHISQRVVRKGCSVVVNL